jgi:hypothetical protein
MEARTSRWGAVGGIAFVVLYLVGNLIFFDAPGSSATAAERAAYFADDANTTRMFVAMYVVVVAGLAFVGFTAALRRRLRASGEQLWFGAAACAILFVAMLFTGAAVAGIMPVNVLFGDNDPELGAETLRMLDIAAGLLARVAGALAVAVFIAIVSRLGRRSGAFPGWLSAGGYFAAVVVAFSFLYIPTLALLIWVLVVSTYLIVRPTTSARDLA